MTMRIILVVISVIALSGCDFGGENGDLHGYINEVKRRPAGTIEPLPTFRPYESFIYSAAAMRSPFDRPVDVAARIVGRTGADIKPDFNREKEYLEGFDLGSLRMVGTLEKGGTLWALISESSGIVHPVREGNYLGKNHGKIVSTSETQIELLEIVSDGLDGWVERPRVLALSEKE